MTTIKLKTKPVPRSPERAPVRGGNLRRPTLSQAQAERQRDMEREKERQQQQPERRSRPAFGDRPRSDRPFGDRPRGDRPYGDRPQGERGQRSSERSDRGDRGGRAFGDRPYSDRPFGDRPRADRPFGDRPRSDHRPFGDRPRGERPQGDRPFGDRPRGDRPQGDRPRGDDRFREERPRFDERRPPRREESSSRDGGPARRDSMAPTDRPPQRERRAPLPPARPVQAGGNAEGFEQRRPARPTAQKSAPVGIAGQGSEGERLSKRLGELGLASRREADDWIAAGWVRVDGKMAVLGQRVRPNAQIEIDPQAREHQAQRMTILLHKPIGYVSGQAEDGYEPAAVLVKPENRWEDDPSKLKYHPGHLRGLAPAGRLDIDSTGMLVLTQDGRIARTLIGDDSVVEKEYLVRVEYQGPEEKVPDSAIALLQHGLELDGVPLRPAKVSWQNEDQLRVVLREGRKRQIRRMCEAVGLKVVGLKRVRIGRIPLGNLPVGQWRYLAPWEHFA